MPGRGAWTLRGGLLPIRPTSTNRAGYYRRAQPGEVPIGAAYARGTDKGHDAYVVWLGVREIQRMCGMFESDCDGIFGAKTEAEVRKLQVRYGLTPDAIVGPATIRAGLTPLIQDLAAHNDIPASVLGGLVLNESGLDPAAVGTNGTDHGIAQYNLSSHPDVTIEQAIDVDWALMEAVEDLAIARARFEPKVKAGVDPLDVAIANHNSPALAATWARQGFPPFVVGRIFQIEDYVARVKTIW